MRGVVNRLTRTACLTLLASALAGCSVFSSGENTQTTAATQSLQFLFGDTPAAPDYATLQQFPYPVTYVQFEDAPRTILVLAQTGTHGQYWFSAGNEALTLWQGRVIRSSKLDYENRVHTDNLSFDPLACYLHGSAEQSCGSQFSRSVQIERAVTPFNPHNPEYEIVTLQVDSQFSRSGRDITETGRATEYVAVPASDATQKAPEATASYQFTNTYRLSTDGNYVIASKQWLSPVHGYVELEMVNLAQPNAPRPAPQTTQFQVPVQQLSGKADGEAPRLRDFIDAMQRQLYPDSYWPGLRIHSDELDQRFSARKAGMVKRLRMLAETYRHDGETELAQAADKLTEQFQQWPLRASYVHGIDPAQMRVTLKQNPLLNAYDADDSYEIVLAEARAGQAGLVTPDMPQGHNLSAQQLEHWLVQPDGNIRKLVPTTAGKAIKRNAQQPGIELVTIKEELLPQGFRDVNAQLAMFIQHWDYAKAAEAWQ
jgi:hypothetical protein